MREAARAKGVELLVLNAGNESEIDSAFASLVRRHGPLVLGACRRVLGNVHDAEDCFQATFLVLTTKAAALGRPRALGPWLYGVACRVARKARVGAARRAARERRAAASEAVPPDDPTWRDLRPVLDEAIARLPSKYRDPLVLCYLEGRTVAEAAAPLLKEADPDLERLLAEEEEIERRTVVRWGMLAR